MDRGIEDEPLARLFRGVSREIASHRSGGRYAWIEIIEFEYILLTVCPEATVADQRLASAGAAARASAGGARGHREGGGG